MKHFFIIAGGKIEDAFAIEVLKGFAEKTVIAADSGMEFLRRNEIVPLQHIEKVARINGVSFFCAVSFGPVVFLCPKHPAGSQIPLLVTINTPPSSFFTIRRITSELNPSSLL